MFLTYLQNRCSPPIHPSAIPLILLTSLGGWSQSQLKLDGAVKAGGCNLRCSGFGWCCNNWSHSNVHAVLLVTWTTLWGKCLMFEGCFLLPLTAEKWTKCEFSCWDDSSWGGSRSAAAVHRCIWRRCGIFSTASISGCSRSHVRDPGLNLFDHTIQLKIAAWSPALTANMQHP